MHSCTHAYKRAHCTARTLTWGLPALDRLCPGSHQHLMRVLLADASNCKWGKSKQDVLHEQQHTALVGANPTSCKLSRLQVLQVGHSLESSAQQLATHAREQRQGDDLLAAPGHGRFAGSRHHHRRKRPLRSSELGQTWARLGLFQSVFSVGQLELVFCCQAQCLRVQTRHDAAQHPHAAARLCLCGQFQGCLLAPTRQPGQGSAAQPAPQPDPLPGSWQPVLGTSCPFKLQQPVQPALRRCSRRCPVACAAPQ